MLKFGVESSQLHVRLDETFYPGFYPVAYFSYIVTTFLLWSTIQYIHFFVMNLTGLLRKSISRGSNERESILRIVHGVLVIQATRNSTESSISIRYCTP